MILSIISRIQARKRIFLRNHYITWLYETNVGVKCSNPIIKNEKYSVLEEKKLSDRQLYLDVDFLKDDYTLCDTSILVSPHFSLMEALDKGQDIKTTDYWNRTIDGTLDSRCKTNPMKKEIDFFYSQYNLRKEEILEDKYEPVTVYRIEDNYYIADGKHRAALCAYLGKDIRCNIVSSDCMLDSFYMWNFKCIKDKKGYSRHIDFFKRLLNE